MLEPLPESNILLLIARFEDMLSKKEKQFFDTEEFEDIIEYYSEKSKWKKALSAVNLAIEQYSFNLDFQLQKSNILITLEKYDKALGLLESIEPMIPMQFELHLYKGDVLMFKEDYAASIKSYKKALDAANTIEEQENVCLDLAFVYQASDNYEMALKYILKSIRLNYHHEEAISELGGYVEFHRNYDQGKKIFLEIIDHNPYCFQAWYYLGICYRELENIELAIESFEYAVIISKSFEPAIIELSKTLSFIGRWEEAIEHFNEALKEEGDKHEIYTQLGNIYYNKRDFENARKHYNLAVKTALSTDFTDELLYKIGECFRKEGEWKKAQTYYQKAYNKYKDALYLKGLAQVSEELKNFEDAICFYEEAIELDPYNERIWLNYSKCLFNCEMYEDAVTVIENALYIMTDSAQLRYLLSAYLYRAGKKQRGQEEFKKGLQLDYLNHKEIIEQFPHLRLEKSIMHLIEQHNQK